MPIVAAIVVVVIVVPFLQCLENHSPLQSSNHLPGMLRAVAIAAIATTNASG